MHLEEAIAEEEEAGAKSVLRVAEAEVALVFVGRNGEWDTEPD